jgi:hypothetical protein
MEMKKGGFVYTLYNYRVVFALILLGILLSMAISFIIPLASAANNDAFVISPVVGQTPTPTPPSMVTTQPVMVSSNKTPYNNNTRIGQGDCVEMGGVYDITGVIGYSFSLPDNYFAYYGKYVTSFDPTSDDDTNILYKYTLPYQRAKLVKFYIDPIIFKDRVGFWYQYTGEYERSANKRAFLVSDNCTPVEKPQYNNAIPVITGSDKTIIIENQTVLETRHVSDIVLARGDPLYINATAGEFQAWLFGGITSVLAKEINTTSNNIIFDTVDTKNWGAGSYTLILEDSGKNGIYEIGYEIDTRTPDKKDLLVPALRSLDIVDVTGYQPSMIRDKLEKMITENTDDNYIKYKVEVQNPSVEIVGYQEIRTQTANYLEIVGYTNKIPNTPVTIYIDLDTANKYKPIVVYATDTGAGNYRTFNAYFDIEYNEMPPGDHSITTKLSDGTFSKVDFYVYEELTPVTRPKYYKFVGGDPYIPIPTPIVVTKEVIKEVVKTEYKTVIQKEEVDYNTLAKNVIMTLVIPVVVTGVVVVIPGIYLITVAIRAFAARRKKNIKIEEVEVAKDDQKDI